MAKLFVTVVGNDILELCLILLTELSMVNCINRRESGKLGNFATTTLVLDIPEDRAIAKRRDFMLRVEEERRHLIGMWVQGDWTHVFIFKKLAIKTRV